MESGKGGTVSIRCLVLSMVVSPEAVEGCPIGYPQHFGRSVSYLPVPIGRFERVELRFWTQEDLTSCCLRIANSQTLAVLEQAAESYEASSITTT